MKILIATDGSPCSEVAVTAFANRPWPAGSEVKLLLVIELPLASTPELWAVPEAYYADYEKAERERAQTVLDVSAQAIREQHSDKLPLATQISVGPPKRVIVDEAAQWGADLILIGSHGYGALERFLLGSVSQAVALHAPCSVEIVRVRPGTDGK